MLDTKTLDAYFTRLRYGGPTDPSRATLDAISLAHVRAIPFENLDVLLGRPISLRLDDVVTKIVLSQRGGYCFEQNSLLMAVLLSLGFRVRPLSARVRLQRPRDFVPPRTHLLLEVDLPEGKRIADVGVGGLSLTSSIALAPDLEQPTAHETRRLCYEQGRWFHQALLGTQWEDVCEFTGEEMHPIDREVANWYTSTHPDSHFKSRLLAARAGPDRTRVGLLDDELVLRDAEGSAEKIPIEGPDDLLSVLAERFGLVFPAGTRFSWPKFADGGL